MSTIVLYTEELDPETFYFRCLSRTKMKYLYQNIFKEVSGDQKCLMCTYLQYNNCEVMHSAIALGKVDLECAETVKSKPTGN